MPYTGWTGNNNYTYTTVATVNKVSSSLTWGAHYLQMYTDATFATPSPAWNCQSGVSCIATTPVAAATQLFIGENVFPATVGGPLPAAVTYTMSVSNVAIVASQGTAAAPVTIALPYNGAVGTVADSFYTYTPAAATNLITATALTADIDPWIFTDATFTVQDPNWICTANIGVLNDTCTTTVPVAVGTPLYIGAVNYSAGAGATFRLQ